MSKNPVILALAFFLEIAALVAMGYWGWTQHDGIGRVLWTIGLVVGASAMWGIFRVPNDPTNAVVAIPGVARLGLEAFFFGLAVILLAAADRTNTAAILGIVIVLYYAASYDRIAWLLKQS